MTSLRIQKALLALTVAAAAAGVALSSSRADAETRIIFGVDLTVTAVQAKKENRDTVVTDPKISKGVKSALIAAFGFRYKRYAFINEQSNMLSWKGKVLDDKENQKQSKRASFDIGTDKQLTITYVGFHQRTRIMFLFEYDGKTSEVEIENGTYFVRKINEDADPIVVVILPKFVEAGG